MYATLKGAENAESLWHALAQSQSKPAILKRICGPALSRIGRMFVDGPTRWGRKASANAMRSSRNALACWHNRMMDLPSQDIIQLADWRHYGWHAMDYRPWPSMLALAVGRPVHSLRLGATAVFVDQRRSTRIDQLRQTGRHRRFTGRDRIWPVCGTHRSRTGSRCRASGRVRRRDGRGFAAAHWGALNALHGRMPADVGTTVAVFAGGLSHIGPMRNRTLCCERIEAQGGALISELCPGTNTEARRFLLRNRIIAAMSCHVDRDASPVAFRRRSTPRDGHANCCAKCMRFPVTSDQPCNAGCNKMIGDHRAIDCCVPPHPPRIYAMNGISPLWQHAQAYRNPQVRTRPKTRRPWKCRQRLRYRQHPRNHRRHRSRHKIQVIRNVRRPSILSLRALNPRMGRRAQLPIPVTTKARVKSFPRRIRCRIFVSSRSPIPRRKPNNVSLSPSCRKWNAH